MSKENKALNDLRRQLAQQNVKTEIPINSISYVAALLAIRHDLGVTHPGEISGQIIEEGVFTYFVGELWDYEGDHQVIKHRINPKYYRIVRDFVCWVYENFERQRGDELLTLPVANEDQYKVIGNTSVHYNLHFNGPEIQFNVNIRGDKYYRRPISQFWNEGDEIEREWTNYTPLPGAPAPLGACSSITFLIVNNK